MVRYKVDIDDRNRSRAGIRRYTGTRLKASICIAATLKLVQLVLFVLFVLFVLLAEILVRYTSYVSNRIHMYACTHVWSRSREESGGR